MLRNEGISKACPSTCSELQLREQLRYILLRKWFLDSKSLPCTRRRVEDELPRLRAFTKDRERLLEGDATRILLESLVNDARRTACSPRSLVGQQHATRCLDLHPRSTGGATRVGPERQAPPTARPERVPLPRRDV